MTTAEADTGPTEPAADAAIVTVVTGLPRSGTSLLMQLLHAGGYPLLTDGRRVPDAHNPRGYHEFDSVKRLPRDASWLAQARGRAVKVISPLVPHLPPTERYRFLHIDRNLEEVLASQRRMLALESRPDPAGLAEALAKSVQAAIAFITETVQSPLLRVDYADLLRDPERSAVGIADFVRTSLDIAAMAAVVEPELHRVRALEN